MTEQRPAPTESPLPPSSIRSGLTLFLVIHLFCVFVALSAAQEVSPLQIKLLNTLRPYTQLFRFDLNSTRYHFSHGDEHEFSHAIEVEYVEGAQASRKFVLPDVGARGGPRRRRFQTLAQVMAFLASQNADGNLGEFAKAIGTNALADEPQGAVVVRCVRHRPQPRLPDRAPGNNPADPMDPAYYDTVYEARVWKTENGRINVIKLSSAGETAPLTDGGASNE